MPPRGSLIAIEGIDGAGKRTQTEMLGRALQARGIACVHFSFPQYESFFGQLVARFLNGDFGSLEAVDPHFSALLYAGDRFGAKPALQAALDSGSTILTDRYVGSNLAHQTARMAPANRAEFMAWLRQLEYGIYGLPPEDLVILLSRSAEDAQQMVGRKAARNYTEQKHDLQEADLNHLEQTAAMYRELAASPDWVTVECTNPGGGTKTREEIHKAVFAAVESRGLARPVAT